MFVEIKAYDNDGMLREKVEILDTGFDEYKETLRYYLNSPEFAEVKIKRQGG